MTVHIGFTGTQSGMTASQAESVIRLLESQPAESRILHHGDCIGADEQADTMARWCTYMIYLHPSTIRGKRAFCRVREDFDAVFDPKPPLERNHDIVDSVCAMIAAPKEMTETLRSGTWATIRYARKQGKPVWIVWPDGTVSEERT